MANFDSVWKAFLLVAFMQLVVSAYDYTLFLSKLVYLLQASGEFILTVSFINYTNPTGLCAECETELGDVTSADQLVPVCCDDQPFTNTSCDNTGEGRCDTRFRWTIRAFGASLETRPVSIPNAANPPYFFTNCLMSPSTCPFSEMSTTFGQGLTAILGVTENPLPVSKTDFLSWTVSLCSFHLPSYFTCCNICIGTSTVLHRSHR